MTGSPPSSRLAPVATAAAVAVAIAVAIVVATLLSGCATTGSSPSATAELPGAAQSTAASSAADAALTSQAGDIADSAVLPPGATESVEPFSAPLNVPSQSPGCYPLIDVARYWSVPSSTVQAVASFLDAHPAPSFASSGSGTISDATGSVTTHIVQSALPQTPTSTTLLFTVAALPSGEIGVRVDAQLIPPGATCTHYGGAAAQ